MKRRAETVKERILKIIAPKCDSENARLVAQRAAYARGDTVILTSSQDDHSYTLYRNGTIPVVVRKPRGFEPYAAEARLAMQELTDEEQS